MNMGLGTIASDNIVFKRKFRWTFKVEKNDCHGPIPEHFVKTASRPNLSVEETEINFLNGKMWIPGKGSWETITVTYYDVGGTDASTAMQELFKWIASIYDFTDPTTLKQSSSNKGFFTSGSLSLYDGCGKTMETWELKKMWPQAVNFGELDYSSSEEATVELTLRYAEVKYTSYCPTMTIAGCCVGC